MLAALIRSLLFVSFSCTSALAITLTGVNDNVSQTYEFDVLSPTATLVGVVNFGQSGLPNMPHCRPGFGCLSDTIETVSGAFSAIAEGDDYQSWGYIPETIHYQLYPSIGPVTFLQGQHFYTLAITVNGDMLFGLPATNSLSFGYTVLDGQVVTPGVPEPGTATLGGVAMLVLCCLGYRRHDKGRTVRSEVIAP